MLISILTGFIVGLGALYVTVTRFREYAAPIMLAALLVAIALALFMILQ